MLQGEAQTVQANTINEEYFCFKHFNFELIKLFERIEYFSVIYLRTW